MARLQLLRAATSLSDVALILGYEPKKLSYILYIDKSAKYQSFNIPKRSGGQRVISAPYPPLKLLQRNLSALMQDCLCELAADKKRNDRAAHGFVREKSIISNARQHKHRRWVFNLDLQDFFTSINFGRVRGFLINDREFTLHPAVATVIAQIACNEGVLPQGSPCSPVFSNMIAHILDLRMVRLASKVGCTYSRYADDLTFSTNKKEFPREVALPAGDENATHIWTPGETVRDLIERSGFKINEKKTHMMYRSSRQDVTGLVVNEKISVKQSYRRTARAMVHRLIRTGSFDIVRSVEKDGVVTLANRPGTLDELNGMLGFINSVDKEYRRVSRSKQTTQSKGDELTAEEKTYKRFLLYRTFYVAPSPVIICEGNTDNVYLTHAIRSLAADYPDLAEISDTGKITLRVRLFKYSTSSTSNLIGLKGGGSGVLKTFLTRYGKDISAISSPGLQHPVIVLFDNDSGAKDILGFLKRKPTDVTPFAFVTKNLYAVPTPGVDTKIESYFDDELKAQLIDGKKFSDANDYDSNTHYGKQIFAHSIVRPNADTINFAKFGPLLGNIAAAIQDYRNRHAAALSLKASPVADIAAPPVALP